jgi:hypothetical protein
MQRLLLINRTAPEALETIRAQAYPGREQAELNSVLRELRKLLDLDSRRPVPPITLPRFGGRKF